MARSKSSTSSDPKGATSKGASRKNHAAGQAEDFLSLWLPFELEIGRLCQSATVAGENEEEERRALWDRSGRAIPQSTEWGEQVVEWKHPTPSDSLLASAPQSDPRGA